MQSVRERARGVRAGRPRHDGFRGLANHSTVVGVVGSTMCGVARAPPPSKGRVWQGRYPKAMAGGRPGRRGRSPNNVETSSEFTAAAPAKCRYWWEGSEAGVCAARFASEGGTNLETNSGFQSGN